MQVSYSREEEVRHPVHKKPLQYELPHVHVQQQHPGGQGEWSDAGRRLLLVFRRAIFSPYFSAHVVFMIQITL